MCPIKTICNSFKEFVHSLTIVQSVNNCKHIGDMTMCHTPLEKKYSKRKDVLEGSFYYATLTTPHLI